MPSAYVTASALGSMLSLRRSTTQATHTAQPTCSDGIAASWLVRKPSPCGALASLPHQPSCDVVASVSTYLGSILGGAMGSSVNPTRPMALAATSALRTLGYAPRCARYAHISTAGVTT